MRARNVFYLLLREVGIGVALVLMIVVFSALAPRFASVANLTNILTQISINTVIAVGMTFVILLGGIDLSVGSVLALATIVGGMVIAREDLSTGTAIALAIAASTLVGCVCGLFNGLVSERWKIHSFIVTLGMLNIARGAASQISNSRTISSFPDEFNEIGSAVVAGVPVIFLIALAIVLAGRFVLARTVFGRMIYAIGNNEEAVRLSGHVPSLYKVAAFTMCGGTVGLAAIMYMMRLNIASPTLGGGFELNAIAAVAIGGTSMSGGKGSMIGTFLGASIIGVLNNGLLLLGLGDFARQIVTGLIIVLAVIIDKYRMRALATAVLKPVQTAGSAGGADDGARAVTAPTTN
ncbi:MAG TPA: ABC transporter permease [Kofleriaceae bacterium]